MPSDIVTILAADVEVLQQQLKALVIVVEAAEEKAATVRRRVLAAHQLYDE
jgi:outer membrane murein-binding lipoprotein Lpp